VVEDFFAVVKFDSSRDSRKEPQFSHLRRQKRHSPERSRKELTRPHLLHLYSYNGIGHPWLARGLFGFRLINSDYLW